MISRRMERYSYSRGGCISMVRVLSTKFLFADTSYFEDDRNIPPLGRIGDPDDILATVLVEDGKVRCKVTRVGVRADYSSVDPTRHLSTNAFVSDVHV